MRVLYYALGGGLGHLARARAVLHTLGCERDALVLSASPFAEDPRVLGGIAARLVPTELERDLAGLRAFVSAEIERYGADCLCVDTFPAGILGELCEFTSAGELWHVARLLRFDEYTKLLSGAPPNFDRCFRVEPLSQAHEVFLARCCERVEDLELREPGREGATQSLVPSHDYWLVVHSGPEKELHELVAFADELRAAEGTDVPLHVASLCPLTERFAGVETIDPFSARSLFPEAGRIVTAAGFNLMRETQPYRHKHVVMPMPRRFDDQYERARRAFA